MTAFDQTWDLVKEWTPNWRETARNLPKLDWHEIARGYNNRENGDFDLLPSYLGSGGSFDAFYHPYDDKFAIKLPRKNSESWSENDADDGERIMNWRMGDPTGREIQVGQPLPSILESYGYPIASELNVDNRYMVQPYIEPSTYAQATRRNRKNKRPNDDVTNKVLHNTFGDRYPSNFGIDQTGNYRFIDPDMDYKYTQDFPRNFKMKNAGELLQNDLNEWGIQLPASSLLNTLDKYGFEREYHSQLFDLLTAIEPYSDNPQSVLIDGKAEFLEGY
tara:strand:+ start:1294 stop:2121 length:828 start_codon:yes stop_codon:yes gene_type:complete